MSGSPVYVIKSTGKVGEATRTVVAEVTQKPAIVNMFGAYVSNQAVTWTGNDYMCGYNHRSDTPTGKGQCAQSGGDGRNVAGGCNENPGAGQWEIPGSPLTGI